MAFEGSPLTQMLRDATTVRAEEIVLSVPDGRSVRMLVNVIPILSSRATQTGSPASSAPRGPTSSCST